MDWIWKLCDMSFESSVVPEDWRPAVLVPLYKGKGKRTKCKNCRGICFLSVVGKIYEGILVDRVRRVTGGLTDDEPGGLRARKVCVAQTFTIRQIGETT